MSQHLEALLNESLRRIETRGTNASGSASPASAGSQDASGFTLMPEVGCLQTVCNVNTAKSTSGAFSLRYGTDDPRSTSSHFLTNLTANISATHRIGSETTPKVFP